MPYARGESTPALPTSGAGAQNRQAAGAKNQGGITFQKKPLSPTKNEKNICEDGGNIIVACRSQTDRLNLMPSSATSQA